jgi:hypothetical protein
MLPLPNVRGSIPALWVVLHEPQTSLSCDYAHMMRRSPDEREALKALVEGHHWTLGEEQAEESAEQR